MRYSKIYKCDISNGPGFRISLFTTGCNHRCKGCFNPETWELINGKIWTEETNKKIIDNLKFDYIDGLSILGGDPFFYLEDMPYNEYINIESSTNNYLYSLLKDVKTSFPDKNIWLWTGYVWEDFFKDNTFSERVQLLLPFIDVIVDGPFIEEKYDRNMKYAGSTNQRVIDVQKSLKNNEVVLYTE